MRFYGKVGAVFHRATTTTTQTNDPVTVTVDDEPVTIEGGTQTFETTTEGWGWLFGGGAEAWLTRYVAIYGELDFARLQGNPTSGGEGELDDRVMLVFFGPSTLDADQRSLHRRQLDLEYQCCVRGNRAVAGFPIGERGRDSEPAESTDPHADEPLVPAFDDLTAPSVNTKGSRPTDESN